MEAFLRLNNGYLVKVYKHKDDFEVFDNKGKKRWFTIWVDDEKGSLIRAIDTFMSDETNYQERFKDFTIT